MKKLMLAALALVCVFALAQPASNLPTQRLRGTVESFDGTTLVMKERSGAVMSLGLADNFMVSEIFPIDLAAIQAGNYVGTAAMPSADGTLRALAVAVFPEAMRGIAEGHAPWDLQAGSTMTNATVGDVASAPQGRTLKLRYKGGEKTLVVPEQTPIVSFRAGDRGLLVPGAKVQVTAQMREGRLTALRAQAGRDGFAPPM